MALRMAVVGAGMVGSHVALLGVRMGLGVTIVARDAERTRARMRAAITSSGEPVDVETLDIRTDRAALAGVDVVYETLPERLDEKQRLFREIEEIIGPDVPIVSGTSSLAPAQLGATTRHPERVFVAHFVHPVTTIALAEILEPETKNPAAHATFMAWIAAMQLEPLVLRQPVAGFIVNRLQFALLREAISLVANGVCSAADVDRVITTALGPRWVATGPLASMDLAGLELFRDVAHIIAPTLENGTITGHLAAPIAAGATGAASGAGFRTWSDGDITRAVEARKHAYSFANELHAEGLIPSDEPG
jgi:3-hydroxybutyryl-CoA dehydrogenase